MATDFEFATTFRVDDFSEARKHYSEVQESHMPIGVVQKNNGKYFPYIPWFGVPRKHEIEPAKIEHRRTYIKQHRMTKKFVESVGLTWPPSKGWIKRLIAEGWPNWETMTGWKDDAM